MAKRTELIALDKDRKTLAKQVYEMHYACAHSTIAFNIMQFFIEFQEIAGVHTIELQCEMDKGKIVRKLLWTKPEDKIVKLEPTDSPIIEMLNNKNKTPTIDWKKPLKHNLDGNIYRKIRHLTNRNRPCKHLLVCDATGEVAIVDDEGISTTGVVRVENVPEHEEKELKFWANIKKDSGDNYYGSLFSAESIALYNMKDTIIACLPVTLKLSLPVKKG